MNKIKMIAFDLDGTLLTTDKRLTEYTKDVLSRAIEKGIEVVPATGRPLMGVPEEFFAFPGVRYIVCSNGARIINAEDKRTLEARLLPYEDAKEILAIFKEYDTMRDIFYDGRGYTEEEKFPKIERYFSTPAMIQYIRTSRTPVKDIDGMFFKEHRAVDKVQSLFASLKEKDEAFERIRKLECEPSCALKNNIEVNAAGVHKGTALLSLGVRLGIRREEIMAFGDGTNDAKMLKTAGVGVAMANAALEVKNAADAITLSNDEEGAAVYIDSHVLGREGRRKC